MIHACEVLNNFTLIGIVVSGELIEAGYLIWKMTPKICGTIVLLEPIKSRNNEFLNDFLVQHCCHTLIFQMTCVDCYSRILLFALIFFDQLNWGSIIAIIGGEFIIYNSMLIRFFHHLFNTDF